MKSRPQLVIASAFVLLLAALAFNGCGGQAPHATLRISIPRNLTHIAVGRTSRLFAYEEYREQGSTEIDAAHAATARDFLRAPIAARWSVSDAGLASISDDGTLSALRPGRVTLKSAWQSYEASTTVEVVRALPVDYLPQLSSRGSQCQPQGVSVSLGQDRVLRLSLSLEGTDCQDVAFEAAAPERPLPWEFDIPGGRLRLTHAEGAIVSGEASLPGASGEIAFTAWTDGDGAYPLSLRGKTVLLVGDSMAEGVGPWLQKRAEAAGARFIDGHECSSTIVWWEGAGKLRELLALYRPDVLFIALGSNEIFLQQPEARAPLIRQMVAEIGSRPAYWIGPPCWKPDTGLIRVIEENFQPGHFYNSNELKVARQPDGKHPTPQGYAEWTELVWSWYARAV